MYKASVRGIETWSRTYRYSSLTLSVKQIYSKSFHYGVIARRPQSVTKKNSEKKNSNSSKSNNPNHLQVLSVLGALVLASTFASSLIAGKMPQPSLDAVPTENIKNDISVIFVLGGPGAGKGTQCAKMVAEYGFVHLSAGDLLREEQKRPGSQYGQLIDEYIKAGKIVPQEVTIGLLDREITQAYRSEGKKRFLVDGFPRKMDQALTFEEKVVPSDFTLFFDCSEEIMLQRLLKRSETSGRTDDNIESIKKRFKTFEETSMPVIEYFEGQHKVVRLDCSKTPDQVYASVKDVLKTKGFEPISNSS